MLRKNNSPVRSLDQSCLPDYLQPAEKTHDMTVIVLVSINDPCLFPIISAPFHLSLLSSLSSDTSDLLPFSFATTNTSCSITLPSASSQAIPTLFPSPCSQKPISVLCVPSCIWLCRPFYVFIPLCKEVQDFA